MKRLVFVALACLAGSAWAETQLVLLATMGSSKAIVNIDGKRRTITAGQEADGVKLLRVDPEGGLFEVDGKQRHLALGEGYRSSGGGAREGGGSLTLAADAGGHFYSSLTINGRMVRGLVDTGATHLSMTAAQARALDIEYARGRPGYTQTANGNVRAWVSSLPQVRIGEITVYDVPVSVRDSNDGAPILIGSSLLSRFEMKQGERAMVLVKKNY